MLRANVIICNVSLSTTFIVQEAVRFCTVMLPSDDKDWRPIPSLPLLSYTLEILFNSSSKRFWKSDVITYTSIFFLKTFILIVFHATLASDITNVIIIKMWMEISEIKVNKEIMSNTLWLFIRCSDVHLEYHKHNQWKRGSEISNIDSSNHKHFTSVGNNYSKLKALIKVICSHFLITTTTPLKSYSQAYILVILIPVMTLFITFTLLSVSWAALKLRDRQTES